MIRSLCRDAPRRPRRILKRSYVRRKPVPRRPTMLDAYAKTIEDWMAKEPHLSAIAILDRLKQLAPEKFTTHQRRTVQRILRTWRGALPQQECYRGDAGQAITVSANRLIGLDGRTDQHAGATRSSCGAFREISNGDAEREEPVTRRDREHYRLASQARHSCFESGRQDRETDRLPTSGAHLWGGDRGCFGRPLGSVRSPLRQAV